MPSTRRAFGAIVTLLDADGLFGLYLMEEERLLSSFHS
jgi:hypothetical protein